MGGSVNKVILIGRVGRTPEVRHTAGGEKIVNLTLATSEKWNDRATGERRERTEWHRVVVFNDRIGVIVEKYVDKGSEIYVEGSLQTRKWTGQDGVEKYTTEVVVSKFRGELTLLGSGSKVGDRDQAAAPVRTQAPAPAQQPLHDGPSWDVPKPGGGGALVDDEIPF